MMSLLFFFGISILSVLNLFALAAPTSSNKGNILGNLSNEGNIAGNLWIPNVRTDNGNQPASRNNQLNLEFNRYKIGDIVAEFEVSGGSNTQSSQDNFLEDRIDVDNTFNHQPNDEDSIKRRDDDYERCKDPASKITLYHKDNFELTPSQTRSRPLTLSTEVYQLGRFDGKDRGQKNSSPFMSVEIKGKCCWETFSESDYRGKMLRLCRGKYNSSTLGRMAGNIKSLRPVKHFN